MNYYGNNNYMTPMQQYGQVAMPIYPNYAQQPQFQMPAQPQLQSQEEADYVWVQGIEGGKAYPVAPNRTVLMQDSNGEYIYKKRADKDGRPVEFAVFKKLEEKSEGGNSSEAISPQTEYATRAELNKINDEILEIKDTLLDIQTTPDTPTRRTRRKSDE